MRPSPLYWMMNESSDLALIKSPVKKKSTYKHKTNKQVTQSQREREQKNTKKRTNDLCSHKRWFTSLNWYTEPSLMGFSGVPPIFQSRLSHFHCFPLWVLSLRVKAYCQRFAVICDPARASGSRAGKVCRYWRQNPRTLQSQSLIVSSKLLHRPWIERSDSVWRTPLRALLNRPLPLELS